LSDEAPRVHRAARRRSGRVAAAGRAQLQLPVIGILSSRSRATDALLIAVIRQGLNDAGFIEGLPQAFLEFMQGGP